MNTLKFEGISSDKIRSDILAIDALHFGDKNIPITDQYTVKFILRELNKVCVGYASTLDKPISTGKWGCGVFNGDNDLKFLLQWIAYSVSGN